MCSSRKRPVTALSSARVVSVSRCRECFVTDRCSDLLIGPRGPVSGNGRTWPEPNGSGRRGSAANGSGGF